MRGAFLCCLTINCPYFHIIRELQYQYRFLIDPIRYLEDFPNIIPLLIKSTAKLIKDQKCALVVWRPTRAGTEKGRKGNGSLSPHKRSHLFPLRQFGGVAGIPHPSASMFVGEFGVL